MLKQLKLTALVLCSFLLIGCSQSTSDDQKNNYEFRIMEDPSSGVLVTFYEKDGKLYYKQVTDAHKGGSNLRQRNDGWTVIEPPGDDMKFEIVH